MNLFIRKCLIIQYAHIFTQMGKTRSTSQNLKHKRYLNKIKGDPEKAKKYREKATQRMRKRRAELAKLNKNNKILIEMKIKEQARSKR